MGASGYTGADLVRLAARHPNIEIVALTANTHAGKPMAEVFPHIDFRREATIGHLMLDIGSPAAELAKVNPPIRPRADGCAASIWAIPWAAASRKRD